MAKTVPEIMLQMELSRRVSTVRLDGDQTCADCRSPLREVNFYGRRLVGCIRCNLWGLVGSGRLFMELPAENLETLKRTQANS